jgi:hypothetical protein
MLAVFEEAAEERRVRGRTVFIRFASAEFLSLLIGAATEWMAKSPRQRPLPVDEVTQTQRHIEVVLKAMDYAIANHQFVKARFLAEAERSAREKLRLLQQKYSTQQ